MLTKLACASFVYGCYRGWTLPMWHNMHHRARFGMTIAIGIKYVLPPFCISKYLQLIARVYYHYTGYTYEKFPYFTKNLYLECGVHHPNVW